MLVPKKLNKSVVLNPEYEGKYYKIQNNGLVIYRCPKCPRIRLIENIDESGTLRHECQSGLCCYYMVWRPSENPIWRQAQIARYSPDIATIQPIEYKELAITASHTRQILWSLYRDLDGDPIEPIPNASQLYPLIRDLLACLDFELLDDVDVFLESNNEALELVYEKYPHLSKLEEDLEDDDYDNIDEDSDEFE